jgi:LacI family transcriptional regulator
MRGRVTAQQIAEACGVSRPTVSRILTGGDRAALHNAETRRRVEDAAKRLGYRPNGAARAMKTGRFGQFALMIGERTSRRGMQPQLMDGLLAAAEEADRHLLVVRVRSEHFEEDATEKPRMLRELACDGLIIDISHDIPPGFVREVAKLDVPLVWINTLRRPRHGRHQPLPGIVVRPDDEGGGYAMTRHLLSLGHTRIAWFDIRSAVDRTFHYSHAARRLGWMRAMREAGLGGEIHRLVRSYRGDVLDPMPVAVNALQTEPKPTAVLSYANGVILAAAADRLGLRRPEELSIATFADSETTLGQTIDFVRVPHREVGRRAVAALLRFGVPEEADEVRIPTSLQLLESTCRHVA